MREHLKLLLDKYCARMKKEWRDQGRSGNRHIEDERVSRSSIGAAGERVVERNEELNHLQTQIEEHETGLPLLERIEIFKKYGMMVTVVLPATGVTIKVVLSSVTNTLKATSQALGKGLKAGLYSAWTNLDRRMALWHAKF